MPRNREKLHHRLVGAQSLETLLHGTQHDASVYNNTSLKARHLLPSIPCNSASPLAYADALMSPVPFS